MGKRKSAGTTKKWTPQEDEKLFNLVKEYGDQEAEWEEIAKHFDGKSGNSCYQRYIYYLDPRVTTEPMTDEEKCDIIILQSQYGNKWAEIARIMTKERTDGRKRTGSCIKNSWHGDRLKAIYEGILNTDFDDIY